jgi:hypothetical protein
VKSFKPLPTGLVPLVESVIGIAIHDGMDGMASRRKAGTRRFRPVCSPCTDPCTAAWLTSLMAEPAACTAALLASPMAVPVAWTASLASLKACDIAPVSRSGVILAIAYLGAASAWELGATAVDSFVAFVVARYGKTCTEKNGEPFSGAETRKHVRRLCNASGSRWQPFTGFGSQKGVVHASRSQVGSG